MVGRWRPSDRGVHPEQAPTRGYRHRKPSLRHAAWMTRVHRGSEPKSYQVFEPPTSGSVGHQHRELPVLQWQIATGTGPQEAMRREVPGKPRRSDFDYRCDAETSTISE